MKKAIVILISVISVVRLASAADNFSYTATNAPGNMPDGVDQSNNPVNVWTLTQTTGATANGTSGAYLGAPFGGAFSGWQIWSGETGGIPGQGGWIDASNGFAGGALSVGQTVSINFEMRATDAASTNGPAGVVGVSLLNGTNNAITFYIYGGGPGWYLYTDAGSTAAKAGPMTYQYQVPFNIAFTVTGTNTYSATVGTAAANGAQDTWTGTFNGSLTGIDVFNHAGGNGSDVGFNNLTVAPELSINNIFPDDGKALFNVTNTMSFGVISPSSVVNASGVQLTLNGVNVSSNLVISGAGTESVTAKYTNLLLNTIYAGQINVTNASGASVSAPVRFDTFSSNYFTWEAEDFDFGGGQFIDNPVISTNGASTYYNQVGVSNVDEYAPNYSATQPHLWRTNDEVSTADADDTPRTQFTAASIPDYLVGYFNPSNWVNYTRTFPAGTYNIYGRLANGNGGLANCYLAEVTGGEGTTSQTTTQLGVFQFSARGWNNFDFIPLSDAWGNPVVVKLNGQTTLRVTCGPVGGGVNMNFFMLAPGTNTPPAIANIYPDGSQPFQTTNSLAFTVSSAISAVSTNNIQVTLNGVNVSSQSTFTGSSTNWLVSVPLPQQGSYSVTITATDAVGNSHNYSEIFDTFSQTNFMIEAGDFDFNGGQFIDNPIETATNVTDFNSYYGYPGGSGDAVYGVDFTTTNLAGETYIYRLDGSDTSPGGFDAAGTEVTSDLLRNKFINTGQVPNEANGTTNVDFDVGWNAPGTWLNYTRTFPTNTYHIWGRLASGASYTNATMSLVTSGQGTTNQAALVLGNFADTNANGFQSWHWVPLTDANGQPVAVSLGGVETLKVTAPSGSPGGSLNEHFYMFVPSTSVSPFLISASVSAGTVSIKFPTQSTHSYTVQYSGSLNPASWQTLSSGIAGDGTVHTVTDTSGGAQRFYRVEAQ